MLEPARGKQGLTVVGWEGEVPPAFIPIIGEDKFLRGLICAVLRRVDEFRDLERVKADLVEINPDLGRAVSTSSDI